MLYDAYEPDFEDDEEEIIDIYNEQFKVLFDACDKRVTFTERESHILDEYVTKYSELLLEFYELRRLFYECDEKSDDYKIKLNQLKGLISEINQIKSKSEKIRNNAEYRFMRLTFKNNIDAILVDAESTLNHVISYSNNFRWHTDLFNIITTKEDRAKAFLLTLIQAVPMHLNYLSGLNEVQTLLDKFYSRTYNSPFTEDNLEYKNIRNIISETYERLYINRYDVIRYGPPLAYFSMLSSKSISENKKALSYLKVEKEGLSVKIQVDNQDNEEITQSMQQLLDYIIIKFNSEGRNDKTVVIDLNEYTKLRKLNSQDKIANQVKISLSKLSKLKISFTSDKKPNNKNYKFDLNETKIIAQVNRIRKGKIAVVLTDEFSRFIAGFPIMQYSMKLFELNEKANPNSYYLLKRLLWHRDINHHHKNANIISVKRLVDACPNLAKYESIVNRGQIRQRIIEPFERDLDAVGDVLTWKYVYKDKEISVKEAEEIDYDKFIESMIHISWTDYPVDKNSNKSTPENDISLP